MDAVKDHLGLIAMFKDFQVKCILRVTITKNTHKNAVNLIIEYRGENMKKIKKKLSKFKKKPIK